MTNVIFTINIIFERIVASKLWGIGMGHYSVLALSTALFLSACSTASKDISATYVSPIQYQLYDCAQLTMEAQRVHGRVSQLGGRLDEAASNDKAITGVGLILFWPALFALGGTKQQEAEYARLRGEYDAVQQTAIAKKCDGFSPVPPTQAPVAPPPSANAQTANSL